MHPFRPRIALPLAFVLLAGCGGESPDAEAEDFAAEEQAAVAEPVPAETAAPPAANPTEAPLTVEDIDRWQRGMEAELQAVREAGTSLANARTGTDSANAIFAATEMSTLEVGANAAGVDQERYRFIRERLATAAEAMTPIEAEADVSNTPAPLLESMKQGREQALARVSADLPPEVLEALRPRAAELRRQDLALVSERLRAAGMGR